MIDEVKARKKASIDAKRLALMKEENHYTTLRRIFGDDDGLAIAEWILDDLCGFWLPGLARLDANALGSFDVGRKFFHALTVADVGITERILSNRRRLVTDLMQDEKDKIEQQAKEIE